MAQIDCFHNGKTCGSEFASTDAAGTVVPGLRASLQHASSLIHLKDTQDTMLALEAQLNAAIPAAVLTDVQ